MVSVLLKDGERRQYPEGTTLYDISKDIGKGLYKSACVGKINGNVVDLRTPVTEDCEVEILTFDSPEGKSTYWHTTAHIMAQAVTRLFPGTKLAIGPSIDMGFYYDFDMEKNLVPEDLKLIEEEMDKIIKENINIERSCLSVNEAVDLMEKNNQPYKLELINEHAQNGQELSFYKQGEFIDLCKGPHLISTGMVKAVKLTSCTGAYWKGNSKNKMLQRIYGISYPKVGELKEYLEMVEEAKKRDHNKLGRELKYFTTVDYIGQGLPILMPKGSRVIQILQRFIEDEEEKRGY